MSEPNRIDRITVGDESDKGAGEAFDLSVWIPDQGSGVGVLLLQEIFGVGAYIKAVAARLARDGFVVAAPDLFWRLHPNWAPDHDEAGLGASFELVQKFDMASGVSDSLACLAHLRDMPEVRGSVGVLGFCLGGTVAHLVAAAGDPDAVVAYYGSGVADAIDQLGAIDCPVQYHFGTADPFIANDDVEKVQAAVEATGRDDLEVVRQPGAGHAFDNHEAPQFHDAIAAASAWAATQRFLTDHLRLA
ncbi:MAG: dienelactone hydrolase family protein [Acidimicrobiales bacterium]